MAEEPPWKPSYGASQCSFEFRLKKCNTTKVVSPFYRPYENDPSIPPYYKSNVFQPVDGIHMIVHSPDEYPLNSGQHLRIMYEEQNTFTFYPEMFLIDDELKSWPLEKRNCYLDGEKKLFFFQIYTKKNCENECLSSLMSRKCGCVQFYLIRKNFVFSKSKDCDFFPGGPSSRLCGVRDKSCVTAAEENFYLDEGNDRKACGCLNQCEYTNIQVKAQQSSGFWTYYAIFYKLKKILLGERAQLILLLLLLAFSSFQPSNRTLLEVQSFWDRLVD